MLDQRLRVVEGDGALFLDREEQLSSEVRLAWARRVLPGEKKDLPLARFLVGPDFFSSWEKIEGISREKVIDVLVQVLTGRDQLMASRALHQLRSGPGGSDAPVSRTDGSTCWRVALQQNTPQARRLHYWRMNDLRIEFSSIRLHDDLRP